jgi:hypothetical protein
VGGVLGLLGVAAVATRSGGAGARIGGALAGLLAGLGLGLLLQEAEVLDPMGILGAALPLLGIAIGGGTAGTLCRRR